jgi:hypothetical protein
MFKLLDSLKRQEAESRRSDLDEYRGILEKGDAATVAEQKRVAVLAAKLGRTVEDVGRELNAVTNILAHEKLLSTEPERRKEYEEAHAEHAMFADSFEKEMKAGQAKLEELMRKRNEAERRYGAARRSKNLIVNIKNENAELFGGWIEPVGPTEFHSGVPVKRPNYLGTSGIITGSEIVGE